MSEKSLRARQTRAIKMIMEGRCTVSCAGAVHTDGSCFCSCGGLNHGALWFDDIAITYDREAK